MCVGGKQVIMESDFVYCTFLQTQSDCGHEKQLDYCLGK
jgi:hypothetical protein